MHFYAIQLIFGDSRGKKLWLRGTLGTIHSWREYSIPIKFFWWASAQVGKLLPGNVIHFYVLQLIFDHSRGKNLTQGRTLGTTHSRQGYSSWIKKFWWALAHVGEMLLVNVMHFYVIQWIFDHSWGKKLSQGPILESTNSWREYSSLIKQFWWASAHAQEQVLECYTCLCNSIDFWSFPRQNFDVGSDSRD